jgi:hypothetical protein
MDLQYPVPVAAQVILLAHRVGVGWPDECEAALDRPTGVREFAQQVAGDRAAEDPAGLVGGLLGKGVELGAGDAGGSVEVTLHALEHPRQIVNELALRLRSAKGVGAPDVGLPRLEHRAEIDIDGVVGLDRAHVWIVGGGCERVRTGTHNASVPVLGDAEPLLGQGEDVFLDLALGPTWRNQAGGLDGAEER